METTRAREILHTSKRCIGVSLNALAVLKKRPEEHTPMLRQMHIEALLTSRVVIRTLKETHPEIFDPPAKQEALWKK